MRRLLLPTRVVWTAGLVDGAERLLSDGDGFCEMQTTGEGGAAVLLDFGRELHGGVRIESPAAPKRGPARVRLRFGESVSEAMGEPNNDHAIHDAEVLVPWYGRVEFGDTGFRFVRIDLLDTKAPLRLSAVRAVFVYRDLDYLGSFACSDQRLNRIWEVGAHTVHLCMQDLVWDGVKRDRLPWIGDLHPEQRVISTVFGEVDVVPATLDYVRDRTPLPGWMNGISSYSLWWVLIQRDWYRWHGSLAYLREQRGYLLGLLDQVAGCLDAAGREHLGGGRFLEWPTSRDETAIDAGLQALTAMALRAGAQLCRALEEPEAAGRAEDAAARAAACPPAPTPSKQANALAVLADMADPAEANRAVLARDPCRGLSTFYGYYVLEARARAGDIAGCLDLIRTYWGGMLDLGATSFWEGFDVDWLRDAARIDESVPEGKHDVHAEYGDYCYKGLRHSLCHGWAAGPTAWLSGHVLGLSPAAPGFRRLRVAPRLGGLDEARGTLPSPEGVVTVRHRQRADGRVDTQVDAPAGIRVELGEQCASPPGSAPGR
ncbi:MAG: alpha-L-rhamnosidase C-terminal domain-containing protein [Planctomycetota bacterium]